MCQVFLFQWWLTNIGYSGDIYYAIVANSLVHLVMYTYYLIATVSKSPWWGKYLTQFQMVQVCGVCTLGEGGRSSVCSHGRRALQYAAASIPFRAILYPCLFAPFTFVFHTLPSHCRRMMCLQFITMIFQSSYLLYNSCPYPHSVLKVYLVYIIRYVCATATVTAATATVRGSHTCTGDLNAWRC